MRQPFNLPCPLRKPVFIVLLCLGAAALAGCTSYPSSHALSGEGEPLTVASIDEGAGGLKVTVAELLPSVEEGRLQTYSTSNMRSQTFVSLADAAWQWERKGPPQLVAIGEEWVRAHGFSAAWAKQLGRLGLQQGRSRPLIAITEGAAGELVRNAQKAKESMTVLRKASWSSEPLPMRSFSYEDDIILPYLPLQNMANGETGVSPHAVLFKKGQYVGLLSPTQTEWLSCLRGDSGLAALSWPKPSTAEMYKLEHVSCHSDVRGNGNLLQPHISVLLRIQGVPAEDSGIIGREGAEEALQSSFAGLVRYLQDNRTDPLRWGDSFRERYAGLWSPDRWRTAYAGAHVTLRLQLKYNGRSTS